MNPNQHQVETIFAKASGLADPEERRAYLDAACAGDETLRQEVESLMAADERSGSFLKTPVADGSATTAATRDWGTLLRGL